MSEPLNPYQTPDEVNGGPVWVEQDLALFSRNQVLVATFFTSFIGGGLMMTLNESRLSRMLPHRPNRAVTFAVLSVVSTLVYAVVAAMVPENIPGLVFSLGSLFIVYAFYNSTQEESFRDHVLRGGSRVSNWVCLGLIVACLVVTIGIVTGAVGVYLSLET